MKNFWILSVGLLVSTSLSARPSSSGDTGGAFELQAAVAVTAKEYTFIVEALVNNKSQKVEERKQVSAQKKLSLDAGNVQKVARNSKAILLQEEVDADELNSAVKSLCDEAQEGYSSPIYKGLGIESEKLKPLMLKFAFKHTPANGEDAHIDPMSFDCGAAQ